MCPDVPGWKQQLPKIFQQVNGASIGIEQGYEAGNFYKRPDARHGGAKRSQKALKNTGPS